MATNPERKFQKKLWIWGSVAGFLGLSLLGLMMPNREPVRLEIFWWWSRIMPIWGVLLLGLVLGAAASLAVVTALWWNERLRRFRSDAEKKQLEQELNALRRLLAKAPQNSPSTTGDDETAQQSRLGA